MYSNISISVCSLASQGSKSSSKVLVSKRKLTVAFLVIALIASAFSSAVMYAVAQGGTTYTISSGVYPGAPAYTIYPIGSTYYAKSAYGVVSSSTNATTVIQNAINSLTSGGQIKLSQGIFNITNSIAIPTVSDYGYSPIPLEIIGTLGTVIQWASGSGGSVFVSADTTEFISHLKLDSFEIRGNNKIASGLNFGNLIHSEIKNMIIDDCDFGIYLTGQYGGFSDDNTIQDSIIRDNNIGIFFGSGEVNNNMVIGVKSYGNINSALTLFNETYFNTFYGGDYSNTISGPNINLIADSSYPSMNKFYGVFSELGNGADIKIYTNSFTNYFYGISVGTFMNDAGNPQYLFGGQVTTINGANPTLVSTIDTYGYKTETRGTVTNAASGDWVTHGLAGTPTLILITPFSGVTVGVNDRNATKFQITFSGGGNQSFMWYSEYRSPYT